MGLNRRVFLQRSGLLLTTLGLSEVGLSLLAERYQQALAQPTRRKLALLIGINQYPEQVCDYPLTRGLALAGCLTDVELQQELLIHRFGFQPSDILTLTDQQATRQNIEEAFLSHLTNQAQAGDVVVFHFSGLGSRIDWDAEATASMEVQNSLVPVDGFLPTVESPVINDLLEETLGLLLRSLPTEQVTTVLDTGYTNSGKTFQGNLRIRSRPNAPTGQPNPAELAFQEQLMQQLQVSREQITTQWRSGQLPGIVLAATKPNQVATEGQWNGFNAGLFTYALTQQLWWTTAETTLRTSLCLATSTVKQVAGVEQQPSLTGQKLQSAKLPTYNLLPESWNADGVIRSVEEDGKVQVWLAGLPTAVLENYGASLLAIVPAAADANASVVSDVSNRLPLLQIRSRDGLTLRARAIGGNPSYSPHAGQLVQEIVRILPRNIGLTVAIDASLERIERVDAISAFSAIPRVTSVVAGEPADFLFGKTVSDATLTASLSPTPTLNNRGYGLFFPGYDVIPNTLIEEDEAVKTAVHRITPQLQTLLALKLLRLLSNRGSSGLGIRATLEMTAPQERIVMQQETTRTQAAGAGKEPKPRVYTADLFNADGSVVLPLGSRTRYQLQNISNQPLYFLLLGLDPTGNPLVFYSTAENAVIPPDETLVVPQAAAEWIVQGPCGLSETHLIFSRSPFTQAYQTLKVASKTDARQVTQLYNPLDVAQAIWQDLHDSSAEILPKIDLPADTYALDVNAWASLSFVYQVVPA